TNVGVEDTARAAHERGYEQVFVEDAMAARDTELHTVTTTKFLPTIGRVRSTRDVSAALG
ncbi:MAG: isochorismatase family protein, partial [Gemmatimonadales bacterium]